MKRLLAIFVGLLAVVLWPTAASAHPLGKFSVNQAVALTLSPAYATVHVSVDFAELPTLANKPTADLSGRTVCSAFLSTFSVSGLSFTLDSSSFAYEAGSAGLSTSRVLCSFRSPASLRDGSELTMANGYLADRVGWREITAVGSGLSLSTSLPSVSPSGDLRAYPADLLTSPVNVRSGTIRVTGLSSAAASPVAPSVSLPTPGGWTAGFEQRLSSLVGSRGLTPLAGLLAVLLSLVLGAAHAALPGHGKTVMAAYMAGRDGRPRDAVAVGATVTLTHTGGVLLLGLALTGFASLAGERVLAMLGVASGGLVAVVGLFLLGRAVASSHDTLAAARHGHSHSRSHDGGADRHGRSHSHDGGADGHGRSHSHDDGADGHGRSHSHGLPGLFRGHSHGLPQDTDTDGQGHSHAHGPHGHSHGADQLPASAPGHRHSYGDEGRSHRLGWVRGLFHGHSHGPDGHTHSHDIGLAHDIGHSHDIGLSHDIGRRGGRDRLGMIGLGVAGGLVPSPTALLVLLGAIGFGRTAFGVALVLAYGLGMAATLTAAGLLLVRVRSTVLDGPAFTRLRMALPLTTSGLILLVGLGMAVRAGAAFV